ncbi:MAG TPA: MFS transporter [Candidatus Acidoferrum sp.]|nr:MFS transporter [Candidatus Acidoferrum sp.]
MSSQTSTTGTDEAWERQLFARIGLRCVPVLLAAFVISYIDRVNVGFAAITASKDLGMSSADFGFGAGLFFISYMIFEAPSNYLLERVGARLWLARIMVCCGLVSAAMFFVSTKLQFNIARFTLGVVEAGLFPGVVLYLTYWFPKRYRARYISLFALGIPLSSVIGSPISGLLLGMDGILGFKGWQWLYVLEAIPAAVVGVLIWILLVDGPDKASWLTQQERDYVKNAIARERAAHPEQGEHGNLWQQLRLLGDKRVILCALVFFGTGVPSYGLGLWLPQIVKGFGVSNFETGLISAVPFVCGSIAMIVWGRRSDRTGERIWHTVAAAWTAAAGLIACIWITSPVLALVALSISGAGIYAVKGPFLSSVSESFSPQTAAVGIALVSSLGNLSGQFAPWMVGVIKDATGQFAPGLLALGLCSLAGGAVMLLRRRGGGLASTAAAG